MKRAFHRRIGDQVAIVVLDTAVLEPVDDLYAEASHVAANMGMLADLMDEATVNIELAEGAHKAVRGQIAVDLLEVSPDLAQWRVEKHLDADARVVQGLSHIARAKGDLAFLKTFHDALRLIADVPFEQRILFIRSGNEWAEGNHLEPDLRFGHGFLEAVREELRAPRPS